MSTYYNEIEPFLAQWLRNLMAAGEIPDGYVDERSICDVEPSDLVDFDQCHFFAGVGGWPLALRLAGWPDDREVWTGSCPCQPFSGAGEGKSFSDSRHLWPEMRRLVVPARPLAIFGEQVASALGLAWLDLVFDDLEAEDYAVGAADICAAGVGAPHIRQRLWWVAYSQRHEQPREKSRHGAPRRMGRQQQPFPWDARWQDALREFRAVDDGLSYTVEATDAPRNAIVPQVAQVFIEAAMQVRP